MFRFRSLLIAAGVVAVAAVPAASAEGGVGPAILKEITQSIVRPQGSRVCARVAGKSSQQVFVYTELSREIPAEQAQASAIANVTAANDVLSRRGLSLAAYAEISSPKRWYGVAVYDHRYQRTAWFRCTKRCEQLGTLRLRRCR